MSVAPLLHSEEMYPAVPSAETFLRLVPDLELEPEQLSSREIFDNSFTLRDKAAEVENKPSGEKLQAIQADVKAWMDRSEVLELPEGAQDRVAYYTHFSQAKTEAKLFGLIDYLAQCHGDDVSQEELDATRSFVEAAFAMYNEKPQEGELVTDDADGSFAFVVPARIGRNHPEYGEEVEPVIPALRYVPNELRAQMMVGLPPFVIDTYGYDDNGRRGYLVFAPATEDMASDLPLKEAFEAFDANVNAAVDFAHRRFGVKVVGLGATLPAYTRYGQKIRNEHVITTTGHGGTTELINMTVEAATQGRTPKTIGVLGLGSIGASIAHITAERFPDSNVTVYDNNPSKITRTLNDASDKERFGVSENEAKLIEESDVVISAIVGTLDLEDMGVTSMEGKIAVDDSQPGCMDPEQVSKLGGSLLWVIGEDSTKSVVTRRGYDYATLVDAHSDVFGCEAEAASISKYIDELQAREMPQGMIDRVIEKVALRSAVTPQQARYIGALFKKYGIVAASPQAFGEPVSLKNEA